MTFERRLEQLGIELPTVAQPRGAYVPAIVARGMCYTTAQLPFRDGAVAFTGRVGEELTIEQGQEAAALATLNAVAAVHQALGTCDRVKQVVRVAGYVASSDTFDDQHIVTNGASELLERLFEDRGRHVRASLGVSGLPLSAAAAVELIVEVAD